MILAGLLIAASFSPSAPEATPVPALVAAIAPAEDFDDFDDARAGAVRELLDELEEVAKWCKKKRLLLERDHIYEAILEYDTDHAAARKELGYKQRSNGTWYRAKPYRPPRNYNETALPEVAVKRREASAAYRLSLLALLDEFGDSLPSARRDAELEKLLVLDPDDEEVRRRLGQVAVGEGEDRRWVLPESRTALETRARLAKLKAEAFDAVPEPEAFQPRDADRDLGTTFAHCVRTDRAEALASTTLDEARRAVRIMHAAPDVLGPLLGVATRGRAGLKVYLLEAHEKTAFINRHPALDEGRRELLLRLSGGWIGSGRRLGEWAGSPDSRIDGLTRQVVGSFLQDTWSIGTKQGWVWEGLGLYLSYELCGTRLTYFVRRTEYTEGGSMNLSSRLAGSNADWLDEARRLLTGERPPNLAFALGKDVNQLEADDLLVSYALAAFLVEAHVDKLGPLLRPIGKGETSSIAALEEVFGQDLLWLQARLTAWLEEVTAG